MGEMKMNQKIPKDNDLGITVKNWLGKKLCKHENQQTFIEHTPNISGEPQHRICKDCGKEIYSIFARYEGNGYK